MVPNQGFEPRTHGLQNRCSTPELVGRMARHPRLERGTSASEERRSIQLS